MLERLRTFINEHDLFHKDDRLLLTVSGGIDSVVLLDLLVKLGYDCGIAHCNFHLRNEESDGDEKFVRELGDSYGIHVYVRNFETAEYAEGNRLSIQMAARELRYDWFEEIRQQEGFDWITTAHNKNDVSETFLLNLSRGTGLQGLTGIKYKSGRLIRPLLFATRDEIKSYALSAGLDWREDSSNASLKYSRNKIRHSLIPLFEEINPKFTDTLAENIQRLKEAEEIYLDAILKVRNNVIHREKGLVWIFINDVAALNPIETWMYEILKEFNFTSSVVNDIIRSLDGPAGRQFFSSTHRLVKDREKLILQLITEENQRRYYIEKENGIILEPLKLKTEIFERSHDFIIPANPDTACLDLDTLEFPLVLRRWETGDYFCPLGMRSMKKLSDFFIDLKLSIPQKENTWILQSGNEICWVIGHRISDNFKILAHTKNILKISLDSDSE
ncbi:MAG: tRNA lysidine(34) synthetase TilS [Bacteroidales bacterium]|nr:tRNA lysidine(34) synthetase TilS [Bacteroidales bacterium]